MEVTSDYSDELHRTSALIRGAVINSMTFLERTMDAFLSYHFCKSDELINEIMNVVFATKHITFENKRIIFNHIISTHHEEYKKLHLDKVHAKLDEFNKHRNALAHYVIDLTDSLAGVGVLS